MFFSLFYILNGVMVYSAFITPRARPGTNININCSVLNWKQISLFDDEWVRTAVYEQINLLWRFCCSYGGEKDGIGILEKGQNSLKEFSHKALIFVDFMS